MWNNFLPQYRAQLRFLFLVLLYSVGLLASLWVAWQLRFDFAVPGEFLPTMWMSIAWIVRLTAPLFTVFAQEISGRDLIMLGGGLFLMAKATTEIHERLEGEAQESSDPWNNAGTGHAANCELNYTPQRADGSVDISRALEVNVEFDMSRQFWS